MTLDPLPKDLPPTPANSLFIANLPLRLSNQDLAWSLFHAFRHFGPLRLIRASRDQHGRPFGFVDFVREENGEAALVAAERGIVVGGRVARVERARFQARLIVTPPIVLESVSSDEKVTIRQLPDRTILQFEERDTAISVFQDLQSQYGGQHQLVWLLPGHHSAHQQAVVRSSGLVQLAPEGSDLLSINANQMNGHGSTNDNFVAKKPAVSHLQTFEEEFLTDTPTTPSHDIYIGRLCSWRVTRDLLKERFSHYGPLLFIRLFNRGVIRPDSPVDAFAHIGFASSEDQKRAIASEDGECWLGQVITVQVLNVGKAQRLQLAAKALAGARDFEVL
jgi:RNA recognition motif-containing protein